MMLHDEKETPSQKMGKIFKVTGEELRKNGIVRNSMNSIGQKTARSVYVLAVDAHSVYLVASAMPESEESIRLSLQVGNSATEIRADAVQAPRDSTELSNSLIGLVQIALRENQKDMGDRLARSLMNLLNASVYREFVRREA